MFRIQRLTPLVSLVLIASSLAFPTGAAAAQAAMWGWVVARNPTTASYVPGPKDQGSSSGLSTNVYRVELGHYQVEFHGINNSYGGDVLVTALGSAPRYCVTGGFTMPTLTDITISVYCHRFNGTVADSAFTASFVSSGYQTATWAFAWADDPGNAGYTPTSQYDGAGSIFIARSGAGAYQVTVQGKDPDHGDIRLTDVINGGCIINQTSSNFGSMFVEVRCLHGDAKFNLLYSKDVGLTGIPGRKAAYLFASQPTAASYTPGAAHSYSSAGHAATVKRTGVGTYMVTLRGMPKGGVAHVTAFGLDGGGHLCQLTSIRTSGTPQKVGVQCYSLGGSLADSKFTLSYTK